jgi:hypothetical protein
MKTNAPHPTKAHGPPLTINSLAELRAAEGEIVGRFATDPLTSQLFLIDPVRALADLGVGLTPAAVAEWEKAAPALRHGAGAEGAARYDRTKALGGVTGLTVNVRSILAPTGVNTVQADAVVAQSLTGRANSDTGLGGTS